VHNNFCKLFTSVLELLTLMHFTVAVCGVYAIKTKPKCMNRLKFGKLSTTVQCTIFTVQATVSVMTFL